MKISLIRKKNLKFYKIIKKLRILLYIMLGITFISMFSNEIMGSNNPFLISISTLALSFVVYILFFIRLQMNYENKYPFSTINPKMLANLEKIEKEGIPTNYVKENLENILGDDVKVEEVYGYLLDMEVKEVTEYENLIETYYYIKDLEE